MARETSQWEREDMEKVVSDFFFFPPPKCSSDTFKIQTDLKILTISKYLLYNLLISVLFFLFPSVPKPF